MNGHYLSSMIRYWVKLDSLELSPRAKTVLGLSSVGSRDGPQISWAKSWDMVALEIERIGTELVDVRAITRYGEE
jgi:hypothetical protein